MSVSDKSLLTADEFLSISLELEDHHAIFYQLWTMGRPVFSDIVKTAAVYFDQQGKWVEFVFNPKYWKKLTPYQRKFVICHECLHVILNHGMRTNDVSRINHDAVNVCLDVVVNESLIRGFGLDRNQLGSLKKDGCWVDTVFPNRKDIPTDAAFEFYLNKLPRIDFPAGLLKLIDDHSGLGGTVWDDVIGELNDKLTAEEKEALKDLIQRHYQTDDPKESDKLRRGEGVGGWVFINVGPVKKKKKWETVIKRWSRKYDRPELREVEQWSRLNRRFALVASDLMLPSELEMEHEIEGKIQVWFFQDTSGSCWHLKDRFFKAARSLNPDRFDVRLFCFDTRVHEVDIAKGKIYGGGGTSFHILEQKIQDLIQGGKYPEAVFVITDGYGTKVSPEKPERWHWFLSQKHCSCIPDECNIHMLSDFE